MYEDGIYFARGVKIIVAVLISAVTILFLAGIWFLIVFLLTRKTKKTRELKVAYDKARAQMYKRVLLTTKTYPKNTSLVSF